MIVDAAGRPEQGDNWMEYKSLVDAGRKSSGGLMVCFQEGDSRTNVGPG